MFIQRLRFYYLHIDLSINQGRGYGPATTPKRYEGLQHLQHFNRPGVYETTVKSERMAKSICRHANKNGERNKMYLEAEE